MEQKSPTHKHQMAKRMSIDDAIQNEFQRWANDESQPIETQCPIISTCPLSNPHPLTNNHS